jgi:hypothetical protein
MKHRLNTIMYNNNHQNKNKYSLYKGLVMYQVMSDYMMMNQVMHLETVKTDGWH